MERANQEDLETYFDLFSKYIEQNGLVGEEGSAVNM